MQPLTEFQDKLVDWLKTSLGLEDSLDELPPDGGLYAETGASQTVASYYDKTALWTVPVLFMSKNADQKEAGQKDVPCLLSVSTDPAFSSACRKSDTEFLFLLLR